MHQCAPHAAPRNGNFALRILLRGYLARFMKRTAAAAYLLLLATGLVTSCESPPHGGATYAFPGNPAYAAPAAPSYQPVAYRPQQSSGRQSISVPAPAFQVQPPSAPMVFASPSDVGNRAPAINAASYILVNARNGDVIAARNADDERGVASTQKILTALIVAEAGDLDRMVRVQASDVTVEPSKLGVKPGELYSRRQLLIGFLVKSANDVANVLARDNAGSIAAFGEKMTAKAHALGATESYFRNPHGLTASGQHSTARDMARIALAAYRNPVIRDAVRRKYFTFRYASGRTTTLENTNDLLGRMPECDGMKTGYTEPAGRCLISCAHKSGREVILVQLGTKTKYIWNDGAKMMRYGLGG
jgi:D-alanyl-D-alanine carboxypeptidase (penicillin-binding protein 5/6)